jgi:hypothetical protein
VGREEVGGAAGMRMPGYPPSPKSVQSLGRREFRFGLEVHVEFGLRFGGEVGGRFEAKVCQVGVVDLE